MKSHFAYIAILIAGILSLRNPLAAQGSGTNRTDSTARSALRSGAPANAPAADNQLRAIQMQRERLNALSAQLNELLTKYTEKDKRVQAIRKQIADLQRQLASEPAATLPAAGSGTNRTKDNNASAGNSNAPANGSSASAHAASTMVKATTVAADTNTNAPTNIRLPASPATSGGSTALARPTDSVAKATETTAKATAAITNGTNATANTNVSANLVTMETLDDTHRLAIGDKLTFRIEEDKYRLAPPADKQSEHGEDEPTPLLVMDSGELEVPYIGLFPAENKTCKQLAYELKTALEKDYFYKATVIVAVDLKAKTVGRVYLTGAVHLPGPLDIPSDEVLTLGKAILRAGGFTDFAERNHVKVTRNATGSSETETLIVDVAKVFDKGKTQLDLPLKPGDLILVPERLVRF